MHSWRDRGVGALSALRGKSGDEPPVDHETILASLLEAVLVVSPADEIVYVNQAAESLLGSSRGSVCGRSAEDLFEASPWIPELLRRLGASEENDLRIEGTLARPDGAKEVLAEASTLRGEQGDALGTVLCLSDMGRRTSINKQDEARVRLAELNRLVASLAHELNNPLSGIRGAAQLLGRKLGEESELLDYTELIVRQADRMAELANALMLLQAPAPQRRPLNIHRVLTDVILLERSPAAEAGVEITHAFDPSLPDVFADPDQLEQVFLNIVKNAVTACAGEGGAVHVTTRMEHGFYVARHSERVRFLSVEFSDDGPGLDPETLTHMFSPLFSATKGGHGMGLAVAQSIANAHGGVIQAQNRSEGGALLRVLLPVASTVQESAGTDQEGASEEDE